MNHDLGSIESLIDTHFDKNPLLRLPFGVLFNFISELATMQFIESGHLDISFLNPLTFVFERNLDLTPLSPKDCRQRFGEVEALHPALLDLMMCANLNIVFPFIHNGIYTCQRLDAYTWLVDYASDSARRAELVDSVLSNLSTPIIPRFTVSGTREHWVAVKRRLDRRDAQNVIKGTKYIQRIYETMSHTYREADLVPDAAFIELGFSSAAAFRQIRQAFSAICYAYMQTAMAVNEYCEQRNLSYEIKYGLAEGLSMAVVAKQTIKETVSRLTGASDSDFDKFGEFFFESGEKRSTISKRSLPPFWSLGDDLYFCPCMAFMSMSVRNLLMTVQNHPPFAEKYKFHGPISDLFEPTLLRRAKHHFEANGYEVVLEKKIPGTEIDMLVYCAKSNTLLTIQAKATLYPEGARMVRNLDRRIGEGIQQLRKFDRLDQSAKVRIINECFPGVGDRQPRQINGILTNAGFGSCKSWDAMQLEQIIATNCNILRHVLPLCADLTELVEQTEKYIERCLALVNHEVKDKRFEIGNQTILQKNLDFDIKQLYLQNLMGE